MHVRKTLLGILIGLCLSLSARGFVDVEQHIWGFSGTIMNDVTIPVSILIRNNTPTPFTGPVYLESRSFGNTVRATQPCYLAPGSQRWVQFMVKADHFSGYQLVWKNGKRLEKFKLRDPAFATRPVVVQISGTSYRERSKFPVYPEHLFPNHFGATRSLHGVILDHMPDWSARKCQALTDWIHAGGILIITEERAGRAPAFSGPLAILNTHRGPLGRGRIEEHKVPSAKFLNDHLPPELQSFEPMKDQTFGKHRPDTPLLTYLRLQMQPDHPWGLINFLSVVYLLLIGPVAMILFRKKIKKVRWSMLYLLIAVTTFSSLFFFLGRRGYGESTSSSSLILAQPLGDNRCYLRSWSQLFVTDSGNYPLHYGEGNHLLNVPSQGEGLTGTYRYGMSATAELTLPVFSTAGILRESIVEHAVTLTVESNQTYQINLNPGDEVFWSRAVVNGDIHQLHHRGTNRFELGKTQGKGLQEEWGEGYYSLQGHRRFRQDDDHEKRDHSEAYQLMAASALNLTGTQAYRNRETPRPLIGEQGTHLFIATTAPTDLLMKNQELNHQLGHVLYHFDLTRLEMSDD